MGRLEGKVAFITGIARGQGRSHAIRLAEEGADIIGIDICNDVDTVPYSLGTSDDLKQTVDKVESLGRKIVATQADTRDYDALKKALDDGVSQLGRLDIVSCNAGVLSMGTLEELSEKTWQDMIDINLTGYWHTVKAAIPHIKKGGHGGSIVMTSSVAGLEGFPNIGHYDSAKHGVVGLMQTLARELASDMIRVNSIHPTQVDTPMVQNDAAYKMFDPDDPSKENFQKASQELNSLPIPYVEAIDVSNALLFLVSEDARYITGATLPVDAGALLK